MRVRVKRWAANGDVFWTEPVLSALAREGHEVEVVSRVPELLQGGPWATGGKVDFDEYVNLDGAYERRPQMHLLHAYADAVGVEGLPRPEVRAPYLYLTPQELEACAVYAHRTPYVLFHLRSLHYRRFRQMHGVDWTTVMDKTAQHAGVARLRDDYPENRRHEVVPTPTLRSAIPVLFGASLFVGVDAAPAHMAASMGVPSIVLFGSVNPRYRHLPGAQVAGLSGRCIHAGCYHAAVAPDKQKCLLEGEQGAHRCTEYGTEEVLSRILGVIGGGGASGTAMDTDLRIDGGAWYRQVRRYRMAR